MFYLACYILHIIQLSHFLLDLFLSEYNYTKYLTFTAGCSVVNWRERRPEIVVSSSGPGRPRRCPGFNSRSSLLDRPAGSTALL